MSEETTCCFTGHRPHRLPWHEDEWDPRCQHLREELDRQVDRAYDRGYRHFISGMAQGGDLMFCPRQQERYRRLLAQCDLETVIQQTYTPDCMLRRNYYMVERSSLLIALYDGNPGGGTCKTLLYAIRRALDVIQLDPARF